MFAQVLYTLVLKCDFVNTPEVFDSLTNRETRSVLVAGIIVHQIYNKVKCETLEK